MATKTARMEIPNEILRRDSPLPSGFLHLIRKFLDFTGFHCGLILTNGFGLVFYSNRRLSTALRLRSDGVADTLRESQRDVRLARK
jgi:hypothetical protein